MDNSITIKKNELWGTPLSKLKTGYREYVLNIKTLLANACSHAERNLKQCGYDIFKNNKSSEYIIHPDKVKVIQEKLYTTKYFSPIELYEFIHNVRIIHNYANHYRNNQMVTIKCSFSCYKSLEKSHVDYPLFEVIEGDVAELTLYGAIINICHFLDKSQVNAFCMDIYNTYQLHNPLYLDIMKRVDAKAKLLEQLNSCCRKTPIINVATYINSNRYFLNTIMRRGIGILCLTIEKKGPLKELNINDPRFKDIVGTYDLDKELLKKLNLVRNWYAHGGYMFDKFSGILISYRYIIDFLVELYFSNVCDEVKKSVKDFAMRILQFHFDEIAKLSIKLLDVESIEDAIICTGNPRIDYRIKKMRMIDPFMKGNFDKEHLTKLLDICGTYGSRYNDREEFHGRLRNFTTKHLEFLTVKSSSPLTIGEYECSYKEFTFINPLCLNFSDEAGNVEFASINGIELDKLLTKDAETFISFKTIDLDELKAC